MKWIALRVYLACGFVYAELTQLTLTAGCPKDAPMSAGAMAVATIAWPGVSAAVANFGGWTCVDHTRPTPEKQP